MAGTRMGGRPYLRGVKSPVSAHEASKARRDCEFAEYVTGRVAAWGRIAYLLCEDLSRADDLVQGAIAKLYVRWSLVRSVNHIDAYARVVLVREFLRERQSG